MSEGGSDNTAVKIVAIIGGVIVVIVVSCGVLGYFIVKGFKETMGKTLETFETMAAEMQQSQAAADKFLTEIQTNDLEGAYQSTTETFKKRMSRKEFDELVKKHPALKEPPTNMGMDPTTPMAPPTSPQALPNNYRYQYHSQSKDGKDSIDITVSVTKDGGQMKVDQLAIKKPVTGNEEKDEP
jgi:cytoskeletal protein RodZ